MAIQFRRGDYDDFDKTKLQEGELAVVVRNDPNTLSGKAVYICYAVGDETQVKRLIHSEDYENDFEELSAELRTEVNEMVSGLELDEAIVKKAFEELNIDTDAFLKQSVITVATDWNTLTDTGIYHIKTTACTNCPTTNWGTLYVSGEGTVFQIWIPDVSLDSIYKRYKSGGWSDWANLTSPDTGWQNITNFGSNIACASNYRCRYRRVGKVVDLRGVITASAAIDTTTSSTFYKIFTLPSGYRPADPLYRICGDLGSGKYWLMIINVSGNVVIAKYSGGSTIPINTSLSFSVSFIIG